MEKSDKKDGLAKFLFAGRRFRKRKDEREVTNQQKSHQEVAHQGTGKSNDGLKAKMQQTQEQHGKQIRNLQGMRDKELEAKYKGASRLNTLLEKVHKWFPIFKETLRMEKLCTVIGFTKDMIECLLTKEKPTM